MSRTHDYGGRLRYKLPKSIHAHIDALHAEYRPKTSRCNFIQYLIRIGMEAFEAGFKDTGGFLEGASEAERYVECWFKPELPAKFMELYHAESPRPYKKEFFAFIVCIGITDYKKRETIAGYDPEYVAAREF